jgi:hypothetical protein
MLGFQLKKIRVYLRLQRRKYWLALYGKNLYLPLDLEHIIVKTCKDFSF